MHKTGLKHKRSLKSKALKNVNKSQSLTTQLRETQHNFIVADPGHRPTSRRLAKRNLGLYEKQFVRTLDASFCFELLRTHP